MSRKRKRPMSRKRKSEEEEKSQAMRMRKCANVKKHRPKESSKCGARGFLYIDFIRNLLEENTSIMFHLPIYHSNVDRSQVLFLLQACSLCVTSACQQPPPRERGHCPSRALAPRVVECATNSVQNCHKGRACRLRVATPVTANAAQPLALAAACSAISRAYQRFCLFMILNWDPLLMYQTRAAGLAEM
jgi:hypothetical protein